MYVIYILINNIIIIYQIDNKDKPNDEYEKYRYLSAYICNSLFDIIDKLSNNERTNEEFKKFIINIHKNIESLICVEK